MTSLNRGQFGRIVVGGYKIFIRSVFPLVFKIPLYIVYEWFVKHLEFIVLDSVNKGDQVSIFEYRDVTEGRVIGESIRLYVMFVSYVVEYGPVHEYYRKVEL